MNEDNIFKKRSLLQTSPELFSARSPKKSVNRSSISSTMANQRAATSNGDVFSWAVFDQKLSSTLDNKLQDVARKEDLVSLQGEVEQLRSENAQLKENVSRLQNRLEQVDRSIRRGRLVVRGLKEKDVMPASDEFIKLCSRKLKTAVGVTDIMKIGGGKAFVVTLETATQYNSVLFARKLLKGTDIFIEKDWTTEEREKRFQLRSLAKKLGNESSLKVRLGDFSLFVNDKHFTWQDGKIVASSSDDAQFLGIILAKLHCDCEVIVNTRQKPITTTHSALQNGQINN